MSRRMISRFVDTFFFSEVCVSVLSGSEVSSELEKERTRGTGKKG